MNRPIKFRAWDKSANEMIEFHSIEYLDFRDGHISYRYYIGDGEATEDIRTDSISSYDLMQYTGLKDKNGKEIYGEDIVRLQSIEIHGDYDDFKVEFSGTFRVVWNTELAGFQLEAVEANVEGWDLSDSHNGLEVIGNIWDHTHLLEQPV